MKRVILLLIILFTACNNKDKTSGESQEIIQTSDTFQLKKAPATTDKTYSNERFRNVTVDKISNDKFRIKGEGQIYEANFNWVVEDGHHELKKGYQMTDAGAPEWGKFDFILEVTKNRENSTLTLILFEISVKDGSRQYSLPIVLF